MKLNPLHTAALALAIMNALAGVSLLLVSGWFIAACALAGLSTAALTFNYVVPAAAIRFLALTRIASGYGEKAVGHHSLLERLQQLRLRWFSHSLNQTRQAPLRAQQAEHLNQSVEDSANTWLSVIHPNVANGTILLLATSLLTWLTPFALTLWMALLAINGLCFIVIFLCQRKAERAKERAQTCYRIALEHQFSNASLWLLSPSMERGDRLIKLSSEWLNARGKQRRIEALGESLLILFSGLAISTLLWQLPLNHYGQALIMLPVILWLATPDWLGNSFRAIRALLGARQSASALPEKISCPPHDTDGPIGHQSTQYELTLNSFGWQHNSLLGCKVSLSLCTGQLVWLKGSSGSGKTSLMEALTGSLSSFGQAQLNKVDLENFSIKQRQEYLHYVEQFPYVLSDSLEHNLRLARPQATREQLHQALGFAGLEALSHDLQHWVGESGRPLSGGEIKRLGLARAWLKDAPIWLLDEPFEGLDAVKQLEIAQKLRLLSQHKLIILASHLWPSEMSVSQIIDLDC